MDVLLKTTNPALVSFITSLLRDAGIHVIVADTHTSILEGSIGVLIPRRILVPCDRLEEARSLIKDADLGEELDARA